MRPATNTAMTRYRTVVDSPIGPLELVATDDAICGLYFGSERAHLTGAVVDDPAHPPIERAARQLAEYFVGSRQEFDLPLAPEGTPFQLEAWQALRTIPYGATISYGEQANRVGDRRKARAVGAANGKNPISIIVPCHRVIGADGSLTGFGGGLSVKTWLLDHERRVIAAAG